MKVKQRQDDDDHGTIMVLTSDPFQSLLPWDGSDRRGSNTMTAPVAAAAPALRYQARAHEEVIKNPQHEFLRPTVAAPIKLPRSFESADSKPAAARGTARDAWCAVALMGMFIVGGIAWTSNRIMNDEVTIADLRTQLSDANATIHKKLEQIKQLYQRVTDAENNAAKSQAMASRAKAR